MSEHPNVERFRRLYKAFNDVPAGKGGVDTIREMLADDLVWHAPGRQGWPGDHSKSEIMAALEEVPGGVLLGEPVIATVDIQVEGIVAADEWVCVRVHYNHTRDGKHLDEDAVEVHRLDGEGRSTEVWVFMRDTAAFDEFLA